MFFDEVNAPRAEVGVADADSSHSSVNLNEPGPATGVLELNVKDTVSKAKRKRSRRRQVEEFLLFVFRVDAGAIGSRLLVKGLLTAPVVANLAIHNLTFRENEVNVELVTVIILFQNHFNPLCPDAIVFYGQYANILVECVQRLRFAIDAANANTCRPKGGFQNGREAHGLGCLAQIVAFVNFRKLCHRQVILTHNFARHALIPGLVAGLYGICFNVQGAGNSGRQANRVLKIRCDRIKHRVAGRHYLERPLYNCLPLGKI
mmetsp:Transcript_56172/g.137972  ORF Transcript_56172/g.137972 Transcript_56172/m.137972 type:complete len:261 (-) Transcript_56172:79-861(-)